MQWKVACSVVMLGLLSHAAAAGPIYVDAEGREWLDVNDTRARSWNDTAAVCNAVSGACSGTLAATDSFTSAIDLTGYHWAGRDEVRDLFYEVAGMPAGSLDTYTGVYSVGSGFGASFFDAFDPTFQTGIGPGVLNILNGLTRDRYFDSYFETWNAYSGIVGNPSYGVDGFSLSGGLPANIREPSMGVFVYREVPVPEPGTLALFGAALAGVFLLRGKRRDAKAV